MPFFLEEELVVNVEPATSSGRVGKVDGRMPAQGIHGKLDVEDQTKIVDATSPEKRSWILGSHIVGTTLTIPMLASLAYRKWKIL